jgi:hypothetical protein
MRALSVETEVNALRAEEEQAEAMAEIHHHLKPPRSPIGRIARFSRVRPDAAIMQPPISGPVERQPQAGAQRSEDYISGPEMRVLERKPLIVRLS